MSERERYESFVDDNARWDHFAHRRGDIVISTPSKSGTTWTQMLVALLVFDGPDFPGPLSQISPWLDMRTRPIGEVVAALDAQTHRRFVKTHTSLDGLVLDDRVTYLCVGRDPRDIAVSMMHHMANMDRDRLVELRIEAEGPLDPSAIPDRGRKQREEPPLVRMRAWMDEPDGGSAGMESLATLARHFRVMWAHRERANVSLFHYADYTRDLPGEIVRLGAAIGIPVSRARAEALAPFASLAAMRDRADDVVPNSTDGLWRDSRQFLRAGGAGEWRDLLDASDLAHYEERAAELFEPSLRVWVHGGRTAADLGAGSGSE